MSAGVGSSGAVVSCLGGDGGRTPPQPVHDNQSVQSGEPTEKL